MIVAVACAASFALYMLLVRSHDVRLPRRRWPRLRSVWFGLGLAILAAALSPAFDVAADRSFALHMLEHILLTFAAAPLLLSGAPLLLVLATAPPQYARPLARALHGSVGRALFFPPLGWIAFVGFFWASHYSGLYELALRSEPIHVCEHLAYLGTAMLFWWPLLAIPPTPWMLGYPARVLYVFLAIPQNAFLSLSLYSSRHVLYPSYGALGIADAFAGQRAAGALMWIVGGLGMLVTVLVLGFGWLHDERAHVLRDEARLDAAAGSPA
ncbi:MAG: cytochrome c oxidase assembly protein [Candidatus Eremiobacteraeota bacterium]|nr:cytochrome c oxidase assembly protein [Candidatus Eremiobacteraeota bacterium]MBC5801800.1 cytochrome c oxidase assembly protein [Candidatus Eremiobacteraeota bacterium]MBC5823134.1 cytochrome c oxidase assembly protein [Candidatus Eremiobacteraeota bacterium]